MVLDAVAGILTLRGYEVLRARTLADARNQMIWQPDFVLTALTMPDGSGLDLIRRLRRRQDQAVIGLVVHPHEPTGKEVALLHPDAIFDHPVAAKEVLAWLLDAT